MRRSIYFLLMSVLLLGSSACEDVTGDRGVNIKAKGVVRGLTFVDRNGNGVLDAQTDGVVAGVIVRLVPRGGGTTTLSAASGSTGEAIISEVPVGEYEVRVDNLTIPDSLRFVKIDSTTVHVLANDTLRITVNLSYPTMLVRDARASAAGKRMFVEGVTLNALGTFGDSTLHISDSTGVIRVTRVQTVGVGVGQKVRVLGTTSTQSGQPTLSDATVFGLGAGTQPAPTQLSTSAAASANSGQLDANLVQISNAVIVGSQTNTAQDVVLSVNDGSGLLNVIIDRQSGIATGSFVPGATLAATGLLVPSATAGVFDLKPRTSADLSATFALVTVAEARQMPTGRAVTLEGVALNSWFSFADSTVHLNDATGSIRGLRVTPVNLFAGDRIRLLGILVLRDGQTVLNNVTATVLGQGVLPLPQVVSTAVAATADAAKLDAALVKILNGTISASSTVANDIFLTVNDDSGPVEVMLDKDIGFATGQFVVGAKIDVTGLLIVKTGGLEWRLKPRQPADVVVH